MSITTCKVVVTLLDPGGSPIQNARVTAKLTEPIVYQGVVVAASEWGSTDADGVCALKLVPNALGLPATSTYSFEILLQGSYRPSYFHGLVVPSRATVTLQELLGDTTDPSALYITSDYVVADYVLA